MAAVEAPEASDVVYEIRDCGWLLPDLDDPPPAPRRPQLWITKGLQACDEAARP